MKVTANGIKTGANGNKTLNFEVGDDVIEIHPAANNENAWQFEATLYVTTVTAIDIVWKLTDGTAVTQGNTAITQDISAAFNIKLTGECADALDSITQKNMIIDYV